MRRYWPVAILAAIVGFLIYGFVSEERLQQAPPSKALRAFGDSQAWILLEPMDYVIGNTSTRISVPAGFVTDLASIPQALWTFGLTPTGQYSRAAIIHDYLYWSQLCTREQADRLLVVAMKESKVRRFDEKLIYRGVQAGGGSAWAVNMRERNEGQPRVLPAEWRSPVDPNMNWPTYRKQAIDAGVRDQLPHDAGSYCRYGDSTDVPELRAPGNTPGEKV